MQGFNLANRLSPGGWALVAVSVSILLLATACRPGGSGESEAAGVQPVDPESTASRISPGKIVAQVREAYAAADTYRDQAVLSLRYQLQGRFLEEPHQWAVEYARGGQLKASIYNARLISDGKRLACHVYDFSSGNLGHQWLIVPVQDSLPIARLFQDGIGRHYLTGQTDLPVDHDNPAVAELFFTPVIRLLEGREESDLFAGATLSALPNREIQGRDCTGIRVTRDALSLDVFVDCQNGLIREIHYPVTALDSRLQDNPEVQGLQIVARFNKATTTPGFSADQFQFELPAEAVPVKRFVAVPEAFPLASIGNRLPDLALRDVQGQGVDQQDWQGKVTLLAWTGDLAIDRQWCERLDEIAKTLDIREYRIGEVRTLDPRVPGDPRLTEMLQRPDRDNGVSVFADFGFAGGQAIDLVSWPALAIVDRQGVLQYVDHVESDLPAVEELVGVLRRVRSGDQVAGEMRREYERFLDHYHTRLASARMDRHQPAGSGDLPKASPPKSCSLTPAWTNHDLSLPGNLVADRQDPQRLFVLDGWRTLATLQRDGSLVGEQELQLPPRQSVSIYRASRGLAMVWSVAGPNLMVLDEDHRLVARLGDEDSGDRIRDAILLDVDHDGKPEPVIAWSGSPDSVWFDLDGGQPDEARPFASRTWRSSALWYAPDDTACMLVCDQDAALQRVTVSESGETGFGTVPISLETVSHVASGQTSQGRWTACVTGINRLGDWQAVVLDEQLREVAVFDIGDQQFDTQIQPVAFAGGGQGCGLWMVVGGDGSVQICSADGQLRDRWFAGKPLTGATLFPGKQGWVVVLCSESGVAAWSLKPRSGSDSP